MGDNPIYEQWHYGYETYWDFVSARSAQRKAERASRAQVHNGPGTPNYNPIAVLPTIRRRERQFVDALFPRIVVLMKKMLTTSKLKRNAAIAAGLQALEESSYRLRPLKNDGTLNEAAVKKVDGLLQLPRIQNAMALKFQASGFAESDANEILIELMRKETSKPSDTLASLKLYYELTGNLNNNNKPGVTVNNNTMNVAPGNQKVYDPATWSAEPKMIISKEKQNQEENA